MKKKILVIIALVAVLTMVVGMGTFANFSRTVENKDNSINADPFEFTIDAADRNDDEVNSRGSHWFKKDGAIVEVVDAYPGFNDEKHSFRIFKKDSEVENLKVKITIIPENIGLFRMQNGQIPPLKIELFDSINDNTADKTFSNVEYGKTYEYTFDNAEFTKDDEVYHFKVVWDKHNNTRDSAFIGKQGKFKIQATVIQK